MKRIGWAPACALVLAALVVSVLAVHAAGERQQSASTAQPPARAAQASAEKGDQPSPDVAALNDALKIADNGKRFPALQKVIDDYPKSEAAAIARAQLASQMTASLIADRNALQTFMAKDLSMSKNPQDYSQLASSLLRVELFLDEAENAAKKGLALDEQTYVSAMKEGRGASRLLRTVKDGVPYYTERTEGEGGRNAVDAATMRAAGRGGRGQADLTDDDLRNQFKTTRQTLMTTLGTIYAKRGKDAEAEKTLKEVWAFDMPPTYRGNLALTLADLAKKAGRTDEELDYRATAYVHGRASALARQALEAMYAKAHSGSVDGLESLLDEKYRKFLKPLEAKPYARPATKNARLVLAELFTGAACPPCVGADMAFDAALERFSREDMAFIVYHEHIPGPDPMTNPATEARKGIYSLRGVPTFAIDGASKVGGGGADAADAIFNTDVAPVVEKAMAVPPEARVMLKAALAGSTIRVNASVNDVKSKSTKLRLHIALVEDVQRYSGPNGVRFHPMVVRSLAGPEFKGFPVAAKGTTVEHVFDVAKIVAEHTRAIDEFLGKPFRGRDKPTFTDGRREAIDASKLLVVAFVQDEDPAQDPPTAAAGSAGGRGDDAPSPVRHVLQAAVVKVASPVKRTTN